MEKMEVRCAEENGVKVPGMEGIRGEFGVGGGGRLDPRLTSPSISGAAGGRPTRGGLMAAGRRGRRLRAWRVSDVTGLRDRVCSTDLLMVLQ